MFPRIAEIRKTCQYGKERVWNLYRYPSAYLTALLAPTHITANSVTALWIFFVVIGFLFMILYPLSYTYRILGAFLIFLAPVLDFVDGELARWRGTRSLTWGEYMDWIGTWFSYLLPLIAVLLLEFWSSQDIFVLYLGLVVIFGYVMFEFIRLENIKIFGPGIGEKTSARTMPFLNKIYRFLRSLFFIDYYHTIFFVCILLDIGKFFLWYYAFGFNLMWMGKAYYDLRTIAQRKTEIDHAR